MIHVSNSWQVPSGYVAAFPNAGGYDCYATWAEVPSNLKPDPVAEVKAQMWEQIKAERDRRKEAGGYMVAVSGVNKWFHSDTFSRTQQLGLVLMGAGIPAGLQWKTMDGSFVTMTQALANAIFSAGAAQDQATFTQAETHHAAMLASATPASYNYLTGWPAIYGA